MMTSTRLAGNSSWRWTHMPSTLPSARSSVEDKELALNEAGWDR
jgi:hypothetical protein